MNADILITISLLKITDNNRYPFEGLTFVNNSEFNNLIFFTKETLEAFGSHNAHRLVQQSCFLHGKLSFNDNNTELDQNKTIEKIDGITRDVILFFGFLWFSKDCCINIDEVNVYFPADKSTINRHSFPFYTSSDCIFRENIFSLDELNFARNVYDKFLELIAKEELSDVKKGNQSKKKHTQGTYNDSIRLGRAITFLLTARMSPMLPYKIALYMPVFECLFSTDSSELTHKVSERCALYLGGTKEEKIYNFKTIKDGYAFRSSILHGAILKPKHNDTEKQIELSRNIDNLARKVLIKVIMEDSASFLPEEMEDYFTNMLFT